MRTKMMILAALGVLALSGCQGRESAALTGAYGDSVVAGQVIMSDGVANSSPVGVEVSVVGTGMIMTLGDDGRFVFSGVPANAVLSFQRASDGIAATLHLNAKSTGSLNVSLSGSSASSGRRRGVERGKQEYEGVIKSVSGDSFVLFTSHKDEVTITTDSSTVIRKGNTTLTVADLKENDRVHVKASLKDKVLLALQVTLQNEGGDEGDDEDNGNKKQEFEGVIKSVSGDSFVLHTSHNEDVTIKTDSTTVIRKGNTTLTVADLKETDRVHVKASLKDTVLVALEVIVQNSGGDGDKDDDGQTMTANGPVKSVEGTTLVIQSQPRGDVTVQTDGSTIIKKQGQIISVSDIKAGDEANCMGTRVDDKTLLARQIEVRGNSKKNKK